MKHALPANVVSYPWPSVQLASALLFWRIYEAQVGA